MASTDSPLEYRVTVGSALGIFSIGFLTAGLLLAVGLLSRPTSYFPMILAAGILAFLQRLRYMSVRLGHDALHVRSFLHEVSIPWSESVAVSRAAERSFTASRLYGPATLEFVSPTATARINFRLYPFGCTEAIMARAVAAGWKVVDL